MSKILARMGDIFEGGADLTVLPCSAKGTISSATGRWVKLFGIPAPLKLAYVPEHGHISQLIEFTGERIITKYIVYAASVFNDYSSPSIIYSISEEIGMLTNRTFGIDVIETPLLGTGAGGLSTEEAGEALFKGFTSSAKPNTTLFVFVFDKDRFLLLDKLFSQLQNYNVPQCQDQFGQRISSLVEVIGKGSP